MLFLPLLVLALSGGPVREHRAPGGCAGRSGFSTGTVGVYAGRETDGRTVTVLDLVDPPALVSWTLGAPAAYRVALEKRASSLDLSGLARAADGTLCALGHLGRQLICFKETGGAAVADRPLPTRAQGIWNVGSRLAYADYEMRPGRPLFHTEDGKGLFGSVRSRSTSDTLGSLTANLVTCGTGLAGSTPCWFLNSTSVQLLDPSGLMRKIDLAAHLAKGGRYPLRDVFIGADGGVWFLVNDPPASSEALAGDARHLVRYSTADRSADSLDLLAPARAILEVGRSTALILFRDGSAADCRLPPGSIR